MRHRLRVEILPQPDLSTCGPTSLHAVYRYHGDEQPLADVIARCRTVERGGTLAVMLGIDALERGYDARIHTFNLNVFDPVWFGTPGVDLAERLARQRSAKRDDERLAVATEAYLRFLALGGRIEWGDLTPTLLRRHLKRDRPLLTGLSSTYLYQEAREAPPDDTPDDVAGLPAGHFVVLCGYDQSTRSIQVADPLADNPLAPDHHYTVPVERVVCSILLGVLTYDANFLIVEPRRRSSAGRTDDPSPRGRQ